MASRDPRVDVYIAEAAEFAQPILERLRSLVHEACPPVEETIKWGMPFFSHAGGILCHMAAFKQHASFGFWKHTEIMGDAARDGMGSFGRLHSLADVPTKKVIVPMIRKAMRLNEALAHGPIPRSALRRRPEPAMPDDLREALNRNRRAGAHFGDFSPAQRRDYVEWITEAKREQTRQRRVMQAVEWIAEGKTRNWKYERR